MQAAKAVRKMIRKHEENNGRNDFMGISLDSWRRQMDCKQGDDEHCLRNTVKIQ